MRRTDVTLTREHILQAALKILDQQGADGLSMRKLAASLDVEAMSLYNHVKNKQDLLNGLADMVLSQIEPPNPALSWDQRLETIVLDLYQVLIQHPFLAVVLGTEQVFPHDPRVLQGLDSMLAALEEGGLSPINQVNAYRGLLAVCFGFVFIHTQGLTKTQEQACEEWEKWDGSEVDVSLRPNFKRLTPYFKMTKAEEDFRFMLKATIGHLRIMVAGKDH